MQSKRSVGTRVPVFLFACTVALTTLLGSAAHATFPYPFPWETPENSVRAALAQQEGQTVVCEATVARIAARNNPPFFVLRDEEWRVNNEPEPRIAVLCRPPASLTGVVRITGTLGRLPNNELCILNPTAVEGLFDDRGQPVYWTPLPGSLAAGTWHELPIPSGPVPPSDPSLPNDGLGIPGEVSAYLTDRISEFDTVASLLAASPPVLSLVQLACESVVSVGDGFIVAGDDNASATAKVYTNATAHVGDRLIRLTGIVHTEDGRLVLYAGSGPSPFFDPQCFGGGASIAGAGTIASMKGVNTPPGDPIASSPASARALANTPPQITTGQLQLSGKVVTETFYAPGTQTVTAFYVQEPETGGNGIKVIPQVSIPVEPGNTVTVTANVIPSSPSVAECYLDASGVECTGSTDIPKPVGTNGRSTAGGEFGCQQALYVQTEDQSASPPRSAVAGVGLSLVGTRVRIWGRVTWVNANGTVCFVDDGSNLKSNYSGAERTGVRVIFPSEQPTTYQVNDYVQGITGVLGAEMSEDTTPQPVPVVRVMRVRSATAHIWYVRPSPAGSDNNTGADWNNAFATIGKALQVSVSGDEVWAAGPSYTGTAAHITLKSGVAVYGGFSGTETAREQRDWLANVTTLDGQGGSPVVYVPSGATAGTRIDGFTIRGGYASTGYGYYGAGIDCSGSPVIADNIITANTADKYGGGVYLNGGSPLLWNNTIQGNTVSSWSGSVLGGGGIYVSNSSAAIIGNTISNNTAYSNANNSATDYGGGIYCSNGSPTIIGNQVTGNSLSVRYGSTYGSGIYSTNASLVLLNNTVSHNTSYGAGIALSGGSSTIANNVVSGHTVSSWGVYGVSLSSGTHHLINNTIISNTYGVYAYCADNSSVLTNNIIAFNSVTGLTKSGSGTPRADYNCVHNPSGSDYSGLTAGAHDVGADPSFVDLVGADYRLLPGSPCTDAGYDADADSSWVDLDGDARVIGTHVDIGADEIPGEDWRRVLALTTETAAATVATPVKATAFVFNVLDDQAETG